MSNRKDTMDTQLILTVLVIAGGLFGMCLLCALALNARQKPPRPARL